MPFYINLAIEQALGENVHFMWLSGGIQPDHNTIANFRSGKLKGKFKKVFNQVVVLLASQDVGSRLKVVCELI